MKKKRGCFWLGMVVFGLLVFALLVNLPLENFSGKRLTIAEDTTVLTGPLRSDGGVDYLAAINQRMSEGVTHESNAASLIFCITPVAAFDLQADGSAGPRWREQARLLGFQEDPEVIELSDPWEAIKETFVSKTLDALEWDLRLLELAQHRKAVTGPWKSAEYPVWVELLDKQGKALQLAGEAALRPHYFRPLMGDLSETGEPQGVLLKQVHLPLAYQTKHCVHWLQIRAMNSLGEGGREQVAAAIKDIQAIRRLACLQSQSLLMIEKLIALASFGIAADAEEQLLNSGQLSVEQLAEYQQFLEQHSCQIQAAELMDQGERLILLDFLQHLQIHGPQNLDLGIGDPSELPIMKFMVRMANLSESMREVNRWYDRLAQAMRIPVLRDSRNAQMRLERELEQEMVEFDDLRQTGWKMIRGAKIRGQMFGLLQVATWSSATRNVFEAEIKAKIQDQVQATAFAIARFQRVQQRYPFDLQELVPDYLPEVPQDPYQSSPLVYRPNPNGFLVYSIGLDNEDQQGRNRLETSNPQVCDLRVCVGPKPDFETGSILYGEMEEMVAEIKFLEREKERRRNLPAANSGQQAPQPPNDPDRPAADDQF